MTRMGKIMLFCMLSTVLVFFTCFGTKVSHQSIQKFKMVSIQSLHLRAELMSKKLKSKSSCDRQTKSETVFTSEVWPC